jgi:hypothetical protein
MVSIGSPRELLARARMHRMGVTMRPPVHNGRLGPLLEGGHEKAKPAKVGDAKTRG